MYNALMAAHDVVHQVQALADHVHAVKPTSPTSDYKPDNSAVPADLKKKVRLLLGFVSWIVTGLCVAGVLMVGGKMAISHRRGEGGEHAAGLAWVGGACILVGSAAAIVGALV
jgi:hypothetical protein